MPPYHGRACHRPCLRERPDGTTRRTVAAPARRTAEPWRRRSRPRRRARGPRRENAAEYLHTLRQLSITPRFPRLLFICLVGARTRLRSRFTSLFRPTHTGVRGRAVYIERIRNRAVEYQEYICAPHCAPRTSRPRGLSLQPVLISFLWSRPARCGEHTYGG